MCIIELNSYAVRFAIVAFTRLHRLTGGEDRRPGQGAKSPRMAFADPRIFMHALLPTKSVGLRKPSVGQSNDQSASAMAANCTVALPCSFSRYGRPNLTLTWSQGNLSIISYLSTKQMVKPLCFTWRSVGYCHEQTIMCVIELNSYPTDDQSKRSDPFVCALEFRL
ncbi:hypothetical protein LF1_29200 [Rubripirellula obstinata]|uniref:Ig-like domain-containing protein n=1 Tax=Rubripirellula obstinata TaxID=406547 RepID=A0A5B1CLG4_9BACT|nr:hypothetical protein LF1_29200 [Rubripirellula obstinata]